MNKLKRIGIAISLGIAIIGGVWLASPSRAAVCDKWINVIECGTRSHQELKSTYYSRSDFRSLMNWNNTNDAMIEGKNMKNGVVYKDGRVVVDGRVVATGARTVQRNTRYPASSYGTEVVGGTKYYKFDVQNSFVYNQFDIFAWFDDNGKFIAGVIKDCET